MNNNSTNNSKTITNILQWILIVVLIALSLYYKNSSCNLKKDIVEMNDKNTTVITYQSSEISKLKDANTELYEKYKNDKQVEYIIQYKYKYKDDVTLTDPTKVLVGSSNTTSEGEAIENDSIQKWLYKDKTDILDYEIGVYAEEKPDSVNFKFELNDTITIVNKKLYDNMYQTYISSTSQSQNPIEPIVVYKPKKKFWDNFSYGPQIGGGVGVINKNFDFYVGFGVTYNLK